MSSSHIFIPLSNPVGIEIIIPEFTNRADCVTYIAVGNGINFSGWKENGTLVSQNNTLTFIVKDEIELSTLFSEVFNTDTDTDYSDDEDSRWSFWNIAPLARIILVAIAIAVIAVISAIIIVNIRKKKNK